MKVIVTDKIGASGLEYLRQHAEVVERYGLDAASLKPELVDADGWMVRSGTQVTTELMAAAPKLKAVARAGSGVDNVDVAEATRRGILVVNAPAGNAVSAAEMTVALLLACARRVPQANASLKKSEWKREAYKGFEISGKTAGLLGLGAVGKQVSRILTGFGARVIAYDPYANAEDAASAGAVLSSKEEVIRQSDILSVHVPLTDETRGMVSSETFEKMKEGSVILNAARGGVVDEEALYNALVSGKIAAAGIDVFAEEPVKPGSWAAMLVALDTVVATPHLGASTSDAQERVALQAAEQLVLALQGKESKHAVNKPSAKPANPAAATSEKPTAKNQPAFCAAHATGPFPATSARQPAGASTAYRPSTSAASFFLPAVP